MYNNPYNMNFYPYNYYNTRAIRPSLFSGFKKYNWNNFLTSTSKTLNVINQAIPIIYQVKPIINNAKTMFRVMNAVKSDDSDTKSYDTPKEVVKNVEKQAPNNQKITKDGSDTLTFFI